MTAYTVLLLLLSWGNPNYWGQVRLVAGRDVVRRMHVGCALWARVFRCDGMGKPSKCALLSWFWEF